MMIRKLCSAGVIALLALSTSACLMKDVNRDPRPPIDLPNAYLEPGDAAADPGLPAASPQ